MQGNPFLGPKIPKERKYVFGHRDRVDEVRDFARSVRDQRYLYIRNYMPHLGYNQPTAWPDIGEIRHEFYKLEKAKKKMSDPLQHFINSRRPVEEERPSKFEEFSFFSSTSRNSCAYAKRASSPCNKNQGLGIHP